MVNSSKYILSYLLLCTLLAVSACTQDPKATTAKSSQQNAYTESVHFERLSGFSLTSLEELTSDKKTVVEFFWYGCPHCKSFTPKLEQWAAANHHIELHYLPIIWNEETELHARIFFLIQDKKNFKALHKEIFNIVAGFSRTDSLDDQRIAFITYLDALGIPANETVDALESREIADKMARIVIDIKNLKITSVPTIIIDKNVKIINTQLKNMNESLNVADFLLIP